LAYNWPNTQHFNFWKGANHQLQSNLGFFQSFRLQLFHQFFGFLTGANGQLLDEGLSEIGVYFPIVRDAKSIPVSAYPI
jgi:hypothetical protein